MKKLIRLASFFLALAALPHPGARAESYSDLRQNVLANPQYRFGFTPAESSQILKLPLGTSVALNLDNGRVLQAYYLGPVRTPDGKQVLTFKTGQEMSPKEFARRSQNAGTTPFSAGSASRVPDEMPAPLAAPPAEAPAAPAPAGAPAPASGSGAGWNRDFGYGGVSDSLGRSAEAGIGAGIATGVVRGLVDTPGNRREMEKLRGEFDAAAARTEAERTELFNKLADYENQATAKIAEVQKSMANYEAFPGPGDAGPLVNPEFAGSEAGQIVGEVRERLGNFEAPTAEGEQFRDMSLQAADASETAFGGGEEQNALSLAEMAKTFADVAMGFYPPTAIAQDAYGLFTGKNLVTGETLSGFERGLAGVGLAASLASAGLASSALHGVEVAGKWLAKNGGRHAAGAFDVIKDFAGYSKKLGLRTAAGWRDFTDFSRRTLGNQLGAVGNVGELAKKMHLGQWAEKFDLHRIRTADWANADYIKRFPTHAPPYQRGTTVFDVITKEKETFVRLHGAGNAERSWVMRLESIDKNLSPAELRVKYSLPFTPESISKVTVQPGTLLRRSKVAPAFGGGANAVQWEILDSLGWNRAKFEPIGPLKDFLR